MLMTSSSVTSCVVSRKDVSRRSIRIAEPLSALPRNAANNCLRSVASRGRKSIVSPPFFREWTAEIGSCKPRATGTRQVLEWQAVDFDNKSCEAMGFAENRPDMIGADNSYRWLSRWGLRSFEAPTEANAVEAFFVFGRHQ